MPLILKVLTSLSIVRRLGVWPRVTACGKIGWCGPLFGPSVTLPQRCLLNGYEQKKREASPTLGQNLLAWAGDGQPTHHRHTQRLRGAKSDAASTQPVAGEAVHAFSVNGLVQCLPLCWALLWATDIHLLIQCSPQSYEVGTMSLFDRWGNWGSVPTSQWLCVFWWCMPMMMHVAF